ncbi:MAG: U32 family peptidase [Mycoplasmoidaceae bacterium]|nr:U32 family peptidase [Mycoplasmoidaceae bacterium]
MSTKDICHVCHLSQLIKAGVTSFKVEGRMKSLHYNATICNNYSHALKDYYSKKLTPSRIKMYEKDLAKAANRDTSIAWFNGQPTQKQMLYRDGEKKLSQNFAFIVDKKVKDGYIVTSKNFFTCKNTFEVFGKKHDLIKGIKITSLFDIKANCKVDKVNKPMYKYRIKTKAKLDVGDIGRITIK